MATRAAWTRAAALLQGRALLRSYCQSGAAAAASRAASGAATPHCHWRGASCFLGEAAQSSPPLVGHGPAAPIFSGASSPSTSCFHTQVAPSTISGPQPRSVAREGGAATGWRGELLWGQAGSSQERSRTRIWASLGGALQYPLSEKLQVQVYGLACPSRGARLHLSAREHCTQRRGTKGLLYTSSSAREFSSASSSPPEPEGGQEEGLLVTHEVVIRERVRLRPPPKKKPELLTSKKEKPASGGNADDSGSPRAAVTVTSEATPPTVGVGLIHLNRPKALNALCAAMMRHFERAMASLQRDPRVGAVVVTGSAQAFAAGADIPEMQSEAFASALGRQMLSGWEAATHGPHARKPIIAAVNGYALGGGCELAMMCDIILVGETAVFGQPEVTLGVIPGMGGTQRLVRAVGKARAMEMVLGGGSFLSAPEAVQLGLASRLVKGDAEAVVEEALALGARIASLSAPVVALAKECVNAAFDSTLSSGLERERTTFYATFSLEDQKEGMAAFAEKREPSFKNR